MSQKNGLIVRIGIDLVADRLGESGCIGFHRNLLRWLSHFAEDERYYIFAYDKEISDYCRYLEDGRENTIQFISLGAGRASQWSRIIDQQIVIPRYFRKLKIDRGFSDNIIPIFAPRKIRWVFRVIMTQQFRKELNNSKLRRIYRTWTTRQAVKRSHKLLPNSRFTLSELQAFCGTGNAKVAVIRDAYDDEVFFPVNKENAKEIVKEEYGIVRPYLLQVSGYFDHKNPLVSFNVLRLLHSAGIKIDFVLIGSDPLKNRERYLTIAKSMGISQFLHLLPFQLPEKLRAFYCGAECFLYPSAWETFGIPPLEAMACGTPVISSNKSAIPEVVGDAGIQVDPQDIEAFTSSVKNVLLNTQLKNSLIEKGLEHCMSFKWKDVVNQFRSEIIED